MSSPSAVPGPYQRLFSTYLGPSRGKIAALTVVLLAGICIQVAIPLIASRFIDEAVGDGTMRRLVALGVLTIALAIVAQGLGVAETWFAERVSWDATNALRIDLLAHLLRLDSGFHLERTQGELIERVDGDVANLARFFSQFVINVLGNIVLMLGIIILVIRLDWQIGVGLAGFVAIALVAMLRIRATSTHQWAAERQGSADFYGLLGEYLGALEDIRANGAGAWVIRRSAEAMRKWLAVIRKAQMRGYALVATSNLAFGFATAFAFGLSAIRYRDDALSLGGVYLVVMYTAMLRRPTEQLRNEVQDFQVAGASLSRVEELLATTPRISDGPGTHLPGGPLSVAFENVTFRYGEGEAVLHNVDLRIEPGRVLGILGRTGSGKTSMIRLVPRFNDPAFGTVRIGDVDIRDVSLDAVRSRIGLVTQEVTLFGASVRDNLALFDDAVPDREILAAIEAVGLAAWFDTLPDGLATRLGPGGAGLSAGQAQLLACARILLGDPDIVILDEASSRLDPVSERLLHHALGRMLANRTGIIIAHRLATFAYADDILVLADGRVQELGPRTELAANPDSHFSRLVRLGIQEATA